MEKFMTFCFLFFALIVLPVIIVQNKLDNNYKKHLGEKCIISKDTLTIVDYNRWDETFILSNGVKINYDLIENNSTKKN